MHLLKSLLLLASCGVAASLAYGLLWHVPAAWNAPHVWTATGKVVEVQAPPPGDAERVPSAGPKVVVEFTDAKGAARREAFSSYNSGGSTVFAGRKPGDSVSFEVAVDGPVPGSRRRFDWKNAGKMHWALGAALIAIGTLLFAL